MGLIPLCETPGEAMVRRIQATPTRPVKRPFKTVIERRSVLCGHCGQSHFQTIRTTCRNCGEFLDA